MLGRSPCWCAWEVVWQGRHATMELRPDGQAVFRYKDTTREFAWRLKGDKLLLAGRGRLPLLPLYTITAVTPGWVVLHNADDGLEVVLRRT